MPSPIYAIDLIKTAMRLKGVLATGETPNADEATDGLRALNDVLETWSIEPYALVGSQPSKFAMTAGKATYSIGPGGDWSGLRPTEIDTIYSTLNGVDFPMSEWSQDEYLSVGYKPTSGLPERYAFVNSAPLATLQFYPTPSQAFAVTVNFPQALTQVPDINSPMVLPPGYARALQYAVAEELGPQYGSPIDLSAAARSSLAIIKRMNRESPVASFDSTLSGRSGGYFWYGLPTA